MVGFYLEFIEITYYCSLISEICFILFTPKDGFITSSGGTHTALCCDIIYIVYIAPGDTNDNNHVLLQAAECREGLAHTALCRDIIYIVYILFYRYLYIRPIYITLYIELRESQTATITFSIKLRLTADCREGLAHTALCPDIIYIVYIL